MIAEASKPQFGICGISGHLASQLHEPDAGALANMPLDRVVELDDATLTIGPPKMPGAMHLDNHHWPAVPTDKGYIAT